MCHNDNKILISDTFETFTFYNFDHCVKKLYSMHTGQSGLKLKFYYVKGYGKIILFYNFFSVML